MSIFAIVCDASQSDTRNAQSRIAGTLAFNSEGSKLVVATLKGEAKVFEVATGNELFALKGHSNWIRSIAFSPDGKRILTGPHDLTAKLWDLQPAAAKS